MSKINKIKLSGTTYDVEDANASKTVELTQAQYDALVQAGTVDPNTFYIITDAQAVDLSEYWTSGQTQSAIDSKVTDIVRGVRNWVGSGVTSLDVNYTGTTETTRTFCASINNKQILTGSDYSKANQFSLVETSAVTSSMTSSSTDAEIPSAKCVYDTLGGLKLVKLTQAQYDALSTKDSNTLYVITTS